MTRRDDKVSPAFKDVKEKVSRKRGNMAPEAAQVEESQR